LRCRREREGHAGVARVAGDLAGDEYPRVSAGGSPELTGTLRVSGWGRERVGEKRFSSVFVFLKILKVLNLV